MGLGNQLVILAFLIALSAFFSASETSLMSLSRLRVRHIYEKGGRIAAAIKKLKDNPQRMLTTILIGNNLVNVAAAAIATSSAIDMFGSNGIGIATGVITLLILVFGEVTPKSFAAQYNEQFSKFCAVPIWYLSNLLYPVIKLFDYFNSGIAKLSGSVPQKPKLTQDFLKSIVDISEEEGAINRIEKEMVNRIFEFDEISVSEVMTPKTDMFMLDSNMKIKKALPEILGNPHARIPLYDGSRENIKGIVHIRDLMASMKNKAIDRQLRKIMRKPLFVPETKKIDSLLRYFQKRKEHMAIVVDEHGSITGLVTMEDILEEIVGEIMDETDKRDPNITKISNHEWLVKGKTDVEDVNIKLNMGIPEEEDYDTFGGFILAKAGKIPSEGERIGHGKFNMVVEGLYGHRITLVRVVKNK